MKYTAEIDVMPLEELLDPQGKAVLSGFKNLELHGINDARVGKHIRLEVEAASEQEADRLVKTACEELLTNRVMESYHYALKVKE